MNNGEPNKLDAHDGLQPCVIRNVLLGSRCHQLGVRRPEELAEGARGALWIDAKAVMNGEINVRRQPRENRSTDFPSAIEGGLP
jgi:hypothetical protein